MQADPIRLVNISQGDVQQRNVADVVRVFREVSQTPEDAKLLRGKVILGFPSYDGDPRPNWAIAEIRGFIQALDTALPYFPYFLVGDPTLSPILFYLLCLISFQDLETRMYAPTDLLDVAMRKTGDVGRFCDQIGDDIDRATEPILLNLPAPMVKHDPNLVEKILQALKPALVGLQDQLASGVPTPEAKAYASQILSQAADLCGIDRSGYPSDIALLRDILARTVRPVSNDELDQFQKVLDACTERLRNGKLAMSSIKVRAAVRQQKDAAYRYVELHLVAAASQPGYLQPAMMIAAAIHVEFGDDGPMRQIRARGEELKVSPETWMPGVSPDLQSARAKFSKGGQLGG